jgi:glyoxylase-like metal-dependent hydrolase (beta-lactamase superfamily II)
MRRIFAATALAAWGAAWSVDAATLQDVAAAMGSARVQSMQYTATGTSTLVGQQFEPSGPYPEVKVPRYARSEDYANAAISLDYALLQDTPTQGGGGLAFGVENPRRMGLKGDQPWTYQGPTPTAAPQVMSQLLTELWTSPQGIVKAALADNAPMTGNAFEVARQGRFKARATVDGRNLVERVEAWVANPVMGDTPVVTTYADYRDFGGVMVPMRISQTTAGFPSLNLTVANAVVNGGTVEPPATIATGTPPQVTMEQAAPGVWFIAGGSHNSVAIEMADHVILVEAPLGDARTVAVIDAVRKQIPNKPLRTVIVTHVHFDHSGGARAAAAEGLAIAAAPQVVDYLQRAYMKPHTIAPDRLARAPRTITFQPVTEGSIFSDATRAVEIFEQRDNPHAQGLNIVYLPKEKILIEADAFSGPRQPITERAANPNSFTANLWANVERAHLAPEIVLPIHGRMTKVDELRMAAGK